MNQLLGFLKERLIGYQLDLVRCPSNKVVFRKSRRTGATWSQSLRMVLACTDGRHQNIISYRYDASKLVIEDCAYWIRELAGNGLADISEWEIQKGVIHNSRSGASITALPCTPRVVRGRKGDTFIDEAAWIPNLSELMDAARPLQMWGGKMTLVSSPFMPGLFTDLCNNPDWHNLNIDIHEAVRQGLYDVICRESGDPTPTDTDKQHWVEELLRDAGKSAPQEYLCQDVSVQSGGWVTADTKFVDVPVLLPDSPHCYGWAQTVPHSIGVDVGVADHPTVIATVGPDGLLSLIEVREWKLPRIADLLGTLINDSTTSLAIDSNGVGRGLADTMADLYPSITKHTPNTSQWLSSHCINFLGQVWRGTVPISGDLRVRLDLSNTGMRKGQIHFQPYKTEEGLRHCDSIPAMAMAYQYQPERGGVHGVWGV